MLQSFHHIPFCLVLITCTYESVMCAGSSSMRPNRVPFTWIPFWGNRAQNSPERNKAGGKERPHLCTHSGCQNRTSRVQSKCSRWKQVHKDTHLKVGSESFKLDLFLVAVCSLILLWARLPNPFCQWENKFTLKCNCLCNLVAWWDIFLWDRIG